jgi:hypothetical protein
MSNKLEHVPNVLKHVADASAGISVIVTWISTLTPLLNFSVILLALVWGYFRIQDMRLSIQIKKIEILKHEEESNGHST